MAAAIMNLDGLRLLHPPDQRGLRTQESPEVGSKVDQMIEEGCRRGLLQRLGKKPTHTSRILIGGLAALSDVLQERVDQSDP